MATARHTTKSAKSSGRSSAKAAPKKAAARPAAKAPAKAAAKPAAGERMTLAQAMRELEAAGSPKTRQTYARHGAEEPMFGVAFGTLFKMQKRVRVDHDLALALWDTGNFDARCFAMKIADPARITPETLDRWAREHRMRGVNLYVASLASESPHGGKKLREWLASSDPALRAMGWCLAGVMSARDESIPDAWFMDRLEQMEKTIHSVTDAERSAMNGALIQIGCRNQALRKAAIATSKRIGKVQVDHGDTACKTPDATPYIEKTWAHSTKMGFESPAAHERSRESMRTRC
ncbi:MAG: DNA alkylation repair protein [Planctomycetes bacterium]|nr:DNA alkylation repair protein [Planctomycetota bacterium]